MTLRDESYPMLALLAKSFQQLSSLHIRAYGTWKRGSYSISLTRSSIYMIVTIA